MALYRLEAKIYSREGRGRSVVGGSAYRTATIRSVVAGAAYRTGAKLKDELLDKTFDYARRVKGVIETMILAPKDAPAWVFDSGTLWNKVEAAEKRKDAQLAREFILAVPPELTAKEQFKLAVDWANKELVGPGMVTELALHHPKSGTNPHVHILCTMRKLEGDEFAAKKSREWNDKAMLQHWRESWCDAENAALEAAGRPERVSHLSLKARGIDRKPQPKIGVGSKDRREKGDRVMMERLQVVEDVKLMNDVMPLMKAIMANGEVTQVGLGNTWWERSMNFVTHAREKAVSIVKDYWHRLIGNERNRGGGDSPEMGG